MAILKKKATKKKTTKKKVVKKKTSKVTGEQRASEYREKKKNNPEKYTFGRPTKYCESFPQKVYDACVSGECLTIASICCFLDIDRDTYYVWKEKHPHFSSAIKKGSEYRKQHMEKKGFNGITGGKDFNAVPWLFLTKNMFPDEYKDKHEVAVGNTESKSFSFKLDVTPEELLKEKSE